MEPSDLLLWRRKRGLTQGDLAGMLKVSRATVNSWENEKSRLPKDIRQRMAELEEKAPEKITARTHPQFFERIGPDQYVKNPRHPDYNKDTPGKDWWGKTKVTDL